jgi:hypothetical protein
VLLDALGKRRGPEDTRTRGQRDHDSLEEICRTLLAANSAAVKVVGNLPGREHQRAEPWSVG